MREDAGGVPSLLKIPVSSWGLTPGLVEVVSAPAYCRAASGHCLPERLVQSCCTLALDTPVLQKALARPPNSSPGP